jgi:hypothetical protein
MMPGLRRQGPFPEMSLPDLTGTRRPLAETWATGAALLLIGHGDCKTTRQVLPYLDRLHRRRGPGSSVRLLLQDDADAARRLVSELKLEVPVGLEEDPYPLAEALGLVAVPTLFLLRQGGAIASVSEGFNRAELESLAVPLGVQGPLFTPEDEAPAFRPG